MSESPSGQPSSATSSDAAASARDAETQTRIEASPFELSQEPVTPEGPAATPVEGATPAPAYEHLGELPATYGTQSVYLVAYDPHQLFAYWDLDWASAGDAAYALHVCRADGEMEAKVDISSADTGRYLPVGQPGGTYYVELGQRGRGGSWQPLAFSGRVTMPPVGLSGETEPKFATLPFHLSFQRLLELIQGAMGHGEDLTAALARLQRGDHPTATAALLHSLDGLNGEQMQTLELLLGQKLGGDSSGGDTGSRAILRDRHEVISSGGAFGSEGLSSSAFSSEHGSIHAPGAGGGSEGLSSLSSAGLAGGAGGSEILASGMFGAGGGSETFSAFVAGLSSETLSSFGLSSEMLAGAGPGGSEAWRMAAAGSGPDSAGIDSERAEIFQRALGNNLDVLGSLFSAVNSGLSSGFGSESSRMSSPGSW